MGYSPLTGLLMSTRCGDIDPMVVLQLIVVYDMRPDEVLGLLSDRSGLLGLSGFSSDPRSWTSRSQICRNEETWHSRCTRTG